MTTTHFIGIDLAADSFVASVFTRPDAKQPVSRPFANSPDGFRST